jgi:hypothetical protein
MAKKKAAKKWTSTELKDRICRRHPLAKGWYTTTEISPASGSGGRAGRMDAVAACLYGGRGFEVLGFEVKISRADWLNELNNPSKNSIGLDEVDRWYVVAPSTDIVKLEELPPKWGLFTCSGAGLRETRRAERLKEESEKFSRPFVVSLLWRVANFETPGDKALATAYEAGLKEGRGENRRSSKHEVDRDLRELERLRKAVDKFEERSGVSIEFGQHAEIMADVVSALRDLQSKEWLSNRLQQAREEATELAELLAKAEDQLGKLTLIPDEGEKHD